MFGVDRSKNINEDRVMTHALLQNWFTAQGRKKCWAAGCLGVTPAAVTLWTQGKRIPAPEYWGAIEKLTGGIVPAAAWGKGEQK